MGTDVATREKRGGFEPGTTNPAETTPTPAGHEIDQAEAREQTRRAASPDPRKDPQREEKKLTIDAGGVARLADTLSFRAKSVKVSNYSTRWLMVNRELFIPPRMVNVIASLPIATNVVDVQQASPGVMGVGVITANQVAFVTYCEERLVEVDGEQIDAASLA